MFLTDDGFPQNRLPCPAGGPGPLPPAAPERESDSMPWRGLDWYTMSECRQNVDGRRSYFPSSSPSWEPTTRTVQLSLAEALDKVAAGEMEPRELIRQLPDKMKGVLDEFATARCGKKLDALPAAQQREILGVLRAMVQKAQAGNGAGVPAGAVSATRASGVRRLVAAAAVLAVLAAGAVLLWLWLR